MAPTGIKNPRILSLVPILGLVLLSPLASADDDSPDSPKGLSSVPPPKRISLTPSPSPPPPSPKKPEPDAKIDKAPPLASPKKSEPFQKGTSAPSPARNPEDNHAPSPPRNHRHDSPRPNGGHQATPILDQLKKKVSKFFSPPPPPAPRSDPDYLEKFVDSLPVPPVIRGDIPGRIINIGMFRTTQSFHRDLPNTTVYAYGASPFTASFPGPIIEAVVGIPTQVAYWNFIPDEHHIFAEDPTVHRAQPSKGGVPTVVHRHGGMQAPKYDGHPSAWFTARGDFGPEFRTNIYHYSNDQRPTLLLYHDHAVGWTRLNVQAGLVGVYVLRDPLGIEKGLSLPSGPHEVILAIADRSFFTNGSMYYPDHGQGSRPVWVPGFLGETVTVNGKVWPYFEAERTAYRFRIVDASNYRTYNLTFVCAAQEDYPYFYLPLKGSIVPFTQIGSQGGYLNEPVNLTSLFLGTAERYDIIIDFAAVPKECADIIVTNNYPQPFPEDSKRPDNNTGTVMKIHLTGRPTRPFRIPNLPQVVPELNPAEVRGARYLHMVTELNESTHEPREFLLGHEGYGDPPSELPYYGSIEVWHMINPTQVLHQNHLHLIQFQLLYRTPFDTKKYEQHKCSVVDPSWRSKWKGGGREREEAEREGGGDYFETGALPSCYTGPPEPPHPNEHGWIDSVKVLPGYVTTIITPWRNQRLRPFSFDPTEAPHYVWHCHLLEHEDNDMMRPLVVVQQPPGETANRNETRKPAFPYAPSPAPSGEFPFEREFPRF